MKCELQLLSGLCDQYAEKYTAKAEMAQRKKNRFMKKTKKESNVR